MDLERWRLIRRVSERHERWLFSTHINRPLSNLITYLLLETSVTPNQVSLSTIPVAVVSSLSYLYGRPIIGGLLLQLSSILDGVDGEIARVRGIASPLGRVIDSLCDRVVEASVCLAIGYASSLLSASLIGFLYATLGLIGLFIDPYLAELVKARTGRPLHETTRLIEARLRFSPADRGLRIFIIFLTSLLHRPELGLLAVGLLSIVYAAVKFLYWLRMRKTSA
jgi:CDP-L-myo-inositol myo-inositolphosphotransferase